MCCLLFLKAPSEKVWCQSISRHMLGEMCLGDRGSIKFQLEPGKLRISISNFPTHLLMAELVSHAGRAGLRTGEEK